jgi:hypothetical protein
MGMFLALKGVALKKIKPYLNTNYIHVDLCKNGKIKKHRLHRLVLSVFINKPFKGAIARHLDGNRKNNCLSNLAWGSVKENSADSKRHGTYAHGDRHGMHKLKTGDVKKIKKLLLNGRTHRSIAKEFKIVPSNVSHISRGVTWGHLNAD